MMTQHSSRLLAPSRAFWPVCLAFVLIGAATLPLAGCSDATSPTAPDADKFVAHLEPVVPVTGGALAVTAPGFGRWLLDADSEPVVINVMPDEPIQFFWRAVGGLGLDGRVTFRYGWNVSDPDDPDDPGWVGPPSVGYKAQQTQPETFWQGVSSLTIERRDRGRLQMRAVVNVESMPVAP
ncbi:MAG: hypothetical protein R3D98_16345 [Candidatus Krumholzibacteriia bacterium]